MPSIVVAGATGMLGKPVTQALVRAGFAVTALVRNPAAAAQVLPMGVKLVQSNLTSATTLAEQLRGQDFLYVSVNVEPGSQVHHFQPERDGMANLLLAAKAAGIQRVGYLSSLIMNYDGFHWWVFDLKRQAVKTLQQSGLPYVIFRPTAFMETLAYRQVQGNKVQGAGKSLHKLHWIAGSDYGQQVVRAFQTIPVGENRDYVIQGPEALDQHEGVAVFAQHYGKGPLLVQWAPLGVLKFIGNFVPKLNYTAKIIHALNHNPEVFQAEAAWRDLGKPTTTLKDYSASIK